MTAIQLPSRPSSLDLTIPCKCLNSSTLDNDEFWTSAWYEIPAAPLRATLMLPSWKCRKMSPMTHHLIHSVVLSFVLLPSHLHVTLGCQKHFLYFSCGFQSAASLQNYIQRCWSCLLKMPRGSCWMQIPPLCFFLSHVTAVSRYKEFLILDMPTLFFCVCV